MNGAVVLRRHRDGSLQIWYCADDTESHVACDRVRLRRARAADEDDSDALDAQRWRVRYSRQSAFCPL